MILNGVFWVDHVHKGLLVWVFLDTLAEIFFDLFIADWTFRVLAFFEVGVYTHSTD